MPLIDFVLQLEGQACNEDQLILWITEELAWCRLEPFGIEAFSDTYFLCLYRRYSCGFGLGIRSKSVPTFHLLCNGFGDKNPPDYPHFVQMLAENIFCGLERRGLQVKYLDGNLKWQET